MIRAPKNDRSWREAPREQTHAEMRELRLLQAAASPVELNLRSGERLSGAIGDWDRDTLSLIDAGGRARVVRKSEIRYVAFVDED